MKKLIFIVGIMLLNGYVHAGAIYTKQPDGTVVKSEVLTDVETFAQIDNLKVKGQRLQGTLDGINGELAEIQNIFLQKQSEAVEVQKQIDANNIELQALVAESKK